MTSGRQEMPPTQPPSYKAQPNQPIRAWEAGTHYKKGFIGPGVKQVLLPFLLTESFILLSCIAYSKSRSCTRQPKRSLTDLSDWVISASKWGSIFLHSDFWDIVKRKRRDHFGMYSTSIREITKGNGSWTYWARAKKSIPEPEQEPAWSSWDNHPDSSAGQEGRSDHRNKKGT